MNVTLRQLRYFLALARQAHFTRAAEAMHVTQPALSMQIRAMEDEVGSPLVERTPSGVVLTPQGPVVTSGGTDRVQSFTVPGGGSGIITRDGPNATVIGPDGRNQHGNGTAPILALELEHDRKTGRLPAGQPITSTYLTSRFHTAGGDVDFAASVNAMLQDIGMRAGEDRLDLRA